MHDLCDDLESIFYTCTSRYISPSTTKFLAKSIGRKSSDEEPILTSGGVCLVRGGGKSQMLAARIWVDGLKFQSPASTNLIWDLHRPFAGKHLYHAAETPYIRLVYRMPRAARKPRRSSGHLQGSLDIGLGVIRFRISSLASHLAGRRRPQKPRQAL